MLDLVRTLRASRWQVLRKIRFPNAVPYIFVGLKLAATMSVIGALVGEFVASERGLGSLIITSGVTMETAPIFASPIQAQVYRRLALCPLAARRYTSGVRREGRP